MSWISPTEPPTPKTLLEAIQAQRAGDVGPLAKLLAKWPELQGVPEVFAALQWMQECYPQGLRVFERARASAGRRPIEIELKGAVWWAVNQYRRAGLTVQEAADALAEELNHVVEHVREGDRGRWVFRVKEKIELTEAAVMVLPFLRRLIDDVEDYREAPVTPEWVRDSYAAFQARNRALSEAGFTLAATVMTPAPPSGHESDFIRAMRAAVSEDVRPSAPPARPEDLILGLRWPSFAALLPAPDRKK